MIYNHVYGKRQTSNSCDTNLSNLQIKQVQIKACAEISLLMILTQNYLFFVEITWSEQWTTVMGKLCHLVQKNALTFGFFQGRDFKYLYRYLENIARVLTISYHLFHSWILNWYLSVGSARTREARCFNKEIWCTMQREVKERPSLF